MIEFKEANETYLENSDQFASNTNNFTVVALVKVAGPSNDPNRLGSNIWQANGDVNDVNDSARHFTLGFTTDQTQALNDFFFSLRWRTTGFPPQNKTLSATAGISPISTSKWYIVAGSWIQNSDTVRCSAMEIEDESTFTTATNSDSTWPIFTTQFSRIGGPVIDNNQHGNWADAVIAQVGIWRGTSASLSDEVKMLAKSYQWERFRPDLMFPDMHADNTKWPALWKLNGLLTSGSYKDLSGNKRHMAFPGGGNNPSLADVVAPIGRFR